jgi:restriction system protein
MITKNLITDSPPDDWHDLQVEVGKILKECGLVVEVDKSISTVRGSVNVDVYAEDIVQKPTITYICECKNWSSAVPKTIVHGFRTVVTDFGANFGLLISSGGFQEGAYEAAANSNVKLLNWIQFQELFIDRWIKEYMLPRLYAEADPLVEYTEPINSRIARKAAALNTDSQKEFRNLQHKYAVLAFVAIRYSVPLLKNAKFPTLPLKTGVRPEHMNLEDGLPAEVLEANSLRQFLEVMSKHIQTGIHAFDKVFGERA